MRRRMAWRYYCGFCGKSGGGGAAMKKHESCCTLNPNRTCRMCAVAGIKQTPMATLLPIAKALAPEYEDMDTLGWERKKVQWREYWKTMVEMTGGCPACLLALLRQTGISAVPPDQETAGAWATGPVWSYQTAKGAFWAAHPREYDVSPE